jgi:hypothetical protein
MPMEHFLGNGDHIGNLDGQLNRPLSLDIDDEVMFMLPIMQTTDLLFSKHGDLNINSLPNYNGTDLQSCFSLKVVLEFLDWW